MDVTDRAFRYSSQEFHHDTAPPTHVARHADPQSCREHIEIYLQQVSSFAGHFRRSPETLGPEEIRTVPGIGSTLATVILLETGDVGRFADIGNYASYCGCVSSTHLSNGKKKGEGNTKNGNRYLAWAYIEAANFALRFASWRASFTSVRRPNGMQTSRPKRSRTN
ncbi:Mobile element protein [Caballeronia sordidicola]|uniref:Mobile element protein n=1 Tax=Caballeronia sordidicola TaxID=196367 RepID=A0A242N7V7_CABSO|nr:IS110 family transposase [Caballeronia sordidicola]OTP79672.1 Mobile element protein [Caballeronia sordidicola]